MALQKTTNSAEPSCNAELIPTSSLEISEPGSEHNFDIFRHKRRLEIPQRSTQPSNADYNDLNNENFQSGPMFEPDMKPTPKASPSPNIKRTPLADVTQESISCSQSTSSLLALIVSLEDELKQSKEKIAELQGEIVAYQDAGYF